MVLDNAAGLRNVGGNATLYQKILKIFLRENQETSSELQKAIESLDYATAVQIVHKIKGSCGTIGAPSLYQNAIKFQKALQDKDKESIELLHSEFKDLLKDLLKTIADMTAKE
jgi:HPt (histidine-containing phosphotransfer) domain-containing protein